MSEKYVTEKDIPLGDLIKSKFGFVVVFHKEKTDQFFVYMGERPEFILLYDRFDRQFFFKGNQYTIEQFKRILNLLSFI